MTKVYLKKDEFGNIRWYKEGSYILHREDGPAVEYFNGDKCWYQNGFPCRTDGPAIEYIDGYKEYWLNGKWHKNIKTNEEWVVCQIIM